MPISDYLPEQMQTTGYWMKFILVFGGLVIVPIFFLDFTKSLNLFTKVLFMFGGAFGVILALNGKSIRLGRKR